MLGVERPTPIRPGAADGRARRSVLAPDDIVVADASYASIWVANYLRATRPGQRFLTPRGLAGLGWGLPMALGAKVAAPDARGLLPRGRWRLRACLGRAGDARGGMRLPVTSPC